MKKIKITKLDRMMSQFVRNKANWYCERCFKKYVPPTNALHNAHIFTRSRHSTRFDSDNCKSLCYGCHSYLDRNPKLKYAWYIEKFGQETFEKLELRSNIPSKIDRVMIELWLRRKLHDQNAYGND